MMIEITILKMKTNIIEYDNKQIDFTMGRKWEMGNGKWEIRNQIQK